MSLALAVVASSPNPLLMLDGDLNIVAGSASFGDAFGIDVDAARGQPLASLGEGEWGVPQLRSLLDATSSGAAKIEAYEMELRPDGRDPRQLVIHAQRLVYLDLDNLRLLMAVADVTDARADQKLRDEVLRRNVVLLQEVRHRVANSLQIIASVLLQNAKRSRSEETRGHLKDAHSRVMSVAALERLLAGTGEGDVEVLAYFTSLCASISASMIAEDEAISLTVAGTAGMLEARASVSLGLIVTELVINALKHAFPDRRAGKIVVDFKHKGPNWTLSVRDDGVGMATDPALVHVGLGTSIVQALASQLKASVETKSAAPGTQVLIDHPQVAIVDDGALAADVKSAAGRPAA